MRSQSIERLLPTAYQRVGAPGSVLNALVEVMAGLHAPSEALLADFAEHFRPYAARADLLPFLACWVGLDHLLGPPRPGGARVPLVPDDRLRDLIASAASLAKVRGTPDGLRRFLETATGVRGFEITMPADRPFHFVVTVPAAAERHRGVIGFLVEQEKPAAATYQVTELEE